MLLASQNSRSQANSLPVLGADFCWCRAKVATRSGVRRSAEDEPGRRVAGASTDGSRLLRQTALTLHVPRAGTVLRLVGDA